MDPETTRVVGKMAFDLAGDLAKQLITLSTAVLALSITFTKDIVKDASQGPELVLRLSWGTYLFSIVCGIWTMMALTGTLMPMSPRDGGPTFAFGGNVRLPAFLQIFAFLVATVLIIVYGIRAVTKKSGGSQDDSWSPYGGR